MKPPISHYHEYPPRFEPDACIAVFKQRLVPCGRRLLVFPCSPPDWIVSVPARVTCKQCLKWLEKHF
jgi:hypothetical protein